MVRSLANRTFQLRCALPADELAFPCEAPADGGLCVNKLGSYHCECISGYKGQDGTLPGKPLADGVQLCFLNFFLNYILTFGEFLANFERPVLCCIDAKFCR